MRIPHQWVLFASAVVGAFSGFILTSFLAAEPLFFHEARAIIRFDASPVLPVPPSSAGSGGTISCSFGEPVPFVKSRSTLVDVSTRLGLAAKWELSLDSTCDLLEKSVAWIDLPEGDSVRIEVRLGSRQDSRAVALSLFDSYRHSRIESQRREMRDILDSADRAIYLQSGKLLRWERQFGELQARPPGDNLFDGTADMIASLKVDIRTGVGELARLQSYRSDLVAVIPTIPVGLVNNPLAEPTRVIPNIPGKSLWGALAGMLLLPGLASLGLSRVSRSSPLSGDDRLPPNESVSNKFLTGKSPCENPSSSSPESSS